METLVIELLLGVWLAFCAAIVLAMLCFGPRILEWLEGTPREI